MIEYRGASLLVVDPSNFILLPASGSGPIKCAVEV